MLDWLADDLITHRVEPDDAIYHGKEGFFRATADWIEDFDDWAVSPEAFLDAGDSVVVRAPSRPWREERRSRRGPRLARVRRARREDRLSVSI
jgi:hypothetical protein